jgi:hypothetical protein
LDPDGGEDWCPYASSPSKTLLEVRFLWVLVSMNAGSLIRLHGVKVLDRAVSTIHGTAGWYGQAMAIPVLANAFVAWLLAWFSPRCENKYN